MATVVWTKHIAELPCKLVPTTLKQHEYLLQQDSHYASDAGKWFPKHEPFITSRLAQIVIDYLDTPSFDIANLIVSPSVKRYLAPVAVFGTEEDAWPPNGSLIETARAIHQLPKLPIDNTTQFFVISELSNPNTYSEPANSPTPPDQSATTPTQSPQTHAAP